MINPNLIIDVTSTLDGTENMLTDATINAAYFSIYKMQEYGMTNRSLMYLYRYGLNLWMGDNGVNPVLPEDSVVRILLKLQEVCLDRYVA